MGSSETPVQAEQKLAHLAAIVDSSDDAIISKDLHGTITSWNRGAERILGYSASEVVGKPGSILIPQDLRDDEPAILARIPAGDRIEHYETIRRRNDGMLIDISLSVSSIVDREGTIVGASKIARLNPRA
jgi:PAS domain S-box-containing protein